MLEVRISDELLTINAIVSLAALLVDSSMLLKVFQYLENSTAELAGEAITRKGSSAAAHRRTVFDYRVVVLKARVGPLMCMQVAPFSKRFTAAWNTTHIWLFAGLYRKL